MAYTFNCYVRTYLPLDANGKPDLTDFGRYDLQINSIGNVALEFDEDTIVVDPVFSYGNAGGNGCVYVFNRLATHSVFNNEVLLCARQFEVDGDTVAAFVNELRGTLDFKTKDAVKSIYHVVSGELISYSKSVCNSFAATAFWANKLGRSELLDIYRATDPDKYMSYSAWEIFDKQYENWMFGSIHKN